MNKILLMTVVVLFILGVECLILLLRQYYTYNSWKTKEIRELVYKGIMTKNPGLTDSKAVRKKFQKVFNHYSLNAIMDGDYISIRYSPPIKEETVKNYFLDMVINDICYELGLLPPT